MNKPGVPARPRVRSIQALALAAGKIQRLRQRASGGQPSDQDGSSSNGSSEALPISTSLRQLWLLKVAIVGGLLAGFLLTPKLWVSSRFYPLTPVWPGLSPLPRPWDEILFGASLILLVAIVFVRKPTRIIQVFLLLAGSLAFLDQSRWQPWFYQYVFMLAALAVAGGNRSDKAKEEAALNTCRLIVMSVYLWSGMQKINPGFVDHVFPWLIGPLAQILPGSIKPIIVKFGILVPLAEVAIGLGLLNDRLRQSAVVGALGMHAFILLAIGPIGRNANTVVWSWNVVMGALVVVLFWRSGYLPVRDLLWPRFLFPKFVFLLFGVAPLLSFANLWDNYLSWALYAGNKNEGTLYLSELVAERLPDSLQEYLTEDKDHPNILEISDWSYGELNAPAYPELRIYRNVATSVCAFAQESSDVMLVVESKASLIDKRRGFRFDCSTLQSR